MINPIKNLSQVYPIRKKIRISAVFYLFLSMVGVFLALWQYQRGHAVTKKLADIYSLKDYQIQGDWQGQYRHYFLVQLDNTERFLIPAQSQESIEKKVYTKAQQARWRFFDEKRSLEGQNTYETIFEAAALMKASVLTEEQSEEEVLKKKWRHYGYAIQWLFLGGLSLWYALKS